MAVSSDGLARAVEPHFAAFKGEVGFYVRHLVTGEETGHNADAPFLTASVFKIPVLVEVFRQAEAGRLSLDDTVTISRNAKLPGSGVLKEMSDGVTMTARDLAMLMIIVSDNTATDLLLDLVGKDAVNATLRALGLERTRVDLTCREILYNLLYPESVPAAEADVSTFRQWKVNPQSKSLTDLTCNDLSTAREISRLLEMIHDGRAANPSSCAVMITILKRQQVNDRIPLFLPRSIEVAHKTGELPGIRNDAGIVHGPSGPYLFACFTRGLPSEAEGCWHIGRLSKAVSDYFESAH